LAGSEISGLCKEGVAVFQSEKVEQSCVRVVRRRKPIRRSFDTWADVRAFQRGNFPAENWPSGCIQARGPSQLLYKWGGVEKCSVCAIKNIEKSVAIGLHQKMLHGAVFLRVNQNRRFRGVVVVQIVWSELKVPLDFASVWINSEH